MAGFTFYEFFAGGGMARAGLGRGWDCLFANDFCEMKAETYARNWGASHLAVGDVANVKPSQLPGAADLVWASFPCQDLSLAGDYRGLGRSSAKVMTRSGTFWPFWKLVQALGQEGRRPKLIALENVYGTITSRQGKDFAAICGALSAEGYLVGAMVINAHHFVPQSRPRVFFVAAHRDSVEVADFALPEPNATWHPPTLVSAVNALPISTRKNWVWWKLPSPSPRKKTFSQIIEADPVGVRWNTESETARLLGMMTPVNAAKVAEAKNAGRIMVGGVYRRTRPDTAGVKHQRAEVRFDDIAGCLRTPAGGSSRQTILVVDGERVRSRLLSPREAARLMGLPESYKLPDRYNDAYQVAGDGVCVPVVRHIAKHLLEPMLESNALVRPLAA